MIIPSSVADAYEHQQVVLELVKGLAGSQLRELCRREHWLFDERLKPVESALAKLETGRNSNLSSMEDLWAAMVVVPTAAEVPAAITQLLDIFEGEQKPSRRTDARSFPYDDVHLVSWLGAKVAPSVAGPEVRARKFEVQIHTGLQYAWWRATHDTVYKGGSGDWRTLRTASQARAGLELLDAVLADLHGAGRLQSLTVVGDEQPDNLAPAAILGLWRATDQPQDVVRFCETVSRLVSACGISLAELSSYMASEGARNLIGQGSITPGQAITLGAAQIVGPTFADRLSRAGLRVLVTREMGRCQPDLSKLGARVAVAP